MKFRIPLGTDKIVHAVIYFLLCWLARRAFYHQSVFPLMKNSAFLGGFIFSCAYGVLDEFHQKFVPGRTADVYDFLADAGGALLYVAIAWMLQRRDHDESDLES